MRRGTKVRDLIRRAHGQARPPDKRVKPAQPVPEPPIDLGFLSLPWEIQDAVNRHAARRPNTEEDEKPDTPTSN